MSDRDLRLFVASDIPSEVKAIIASAGERARASLPVARWMKTENLHLTLKFIGAYPEEDVGGLSNELRETGERCAPFEAALGGCGAFPSPGLRR